MELWVWYTFGSIASMAILALVDYAMGKNFYKNAEGASIVGGFFVMVIFFYALIFKGIDFSNIEFIVSAYILGLLSLFGAYYYWKSLFNNTSPGTLASIIKLQIVFAFIVGVFFFQEKLSSLQLLGHGIIFLGAAYLAIKDFKVSGKTESYIFPLVTMVLWTTGIIGMDYLYSQYDFWSLIGMQSLGLFSGALFLLFFTSGGVQFQQDFKLRMRDYIIMGAITEAFGISMYLFDGLAYDAGPLSKVTFLRETYPVFLIIIALFLRPYFPKYIADEGGDSKFEKITIVCIMMIGVYLTIS